MTNVVDGDTVDVSTGDKVRLIGIDTPERGACGAAEATANMEALVLGKRVKLTAASAKDDKDRFGRLVRYVDVVGGVALDAGMNQIKKGLAIARYDSRDGYRAHPRERRYIAADRAAADVTCEEPEEPEEPPEEPPPPASNCHPSYVGACLPIGPDLDCADVPTTVQVVGPDEYRLDGDNDGWGCE